MLQALARANLSEARAGQIVLGSSLAWIAGDERAADDAHASIDFASTDQRLAKLTA
jgi:hypothetical protein